MRTGLEPATLGVTGRYSNQLNYRTKNKESRQGSNLSRHIPKKDCSTTELLDSLSERPDSNRRPWPWQGHALPTELLSPWVDPGPACRSRRYGRALLKVYFVAGGGFEPPTFGLWAQQATTALPRYLLYKHTQNFWISKFFFCTPWEIRTPKTSSVVKWFIH